MITNCDDEDVDYDGNIDGDDYHSSDNNNDDYVLQMMKM